MEQGFLYKSYFVFCILMRPAISFFKSKISNFLWKKKFSLLYPDRGIYPIGTCLQPENLTWAVTPHPNDRTAILQVKRTNGYMYKSINDKLVTVERLESKIEVPRMFETQKVRRHEKFRKEWSNIRKNASPKWENDFTHWLWLDLMLVTKNWGSSVSDNVPTLFKLSGRVISF